MVAFQVTVADKPGPWHVPVSRAGDLQAGDVIRIWHEMNGTWIPGWWMEVVQIMGSDLQLRDLMSGEIKSRMVGETVGGAYKHPDPQAARAAGQMQTARETERTQRDATESRAPRAIDLEALRIGRRIARGGR